MYVLSQGLSLIVTQCQILEIVCKINEFLINLQPDLWPYYDDGHISLIAPLT